MSVHVLDVSFTYPGSGRAALRDVSVDIDGGSYVAVLGANGSGKSTLARCLTGLLSPDTGSITSTPEAEVPSALVFQSPGDQIVAETVELDTAFGPENLGVSPDEMRVRVPAALEVFHLAVRSGEATASLSTGNKQLLALAGVHVLQSSVLVLDEPTSMLSPKIRTELLDYLDTQHAAGGTIIHITHDREEAARAQRVLVMEDGSIVFDGSPRALFAIPEQQQEQWGILASFPGMQTREVSRDIALECHDIVEGPLQGFSARFPAGSITAVTGESGSGKSTLLEILAGLRVPETGSVLCREQCAIALAVQESEASLFAEFVSDDVAYGPRNSGIAGKELVARVASAMNAASLPFDTFRDRTTFSLSGGERRKAALAGIIAMDTPVILFDEPSSALDVRSRAQLLVLIADLASRGKTVVFTTNREDECRIADFVITLPAHGKERSVGSVTKKLDRNQATLERLRQGEKGSYEPGSSPFHILSPAGKYWCTIAPITAALAVGNLSAMMAVLLIEAGIVFVSRYPLLQFLRKFLVILPWLLLVALMQYLVFRNRQIDPVFLLRFIGLFIPLSVFVYSTSHSEIMYGVEDLCKPLILLRVPVRDLSLLVGMVFRFIPLLYTEAGRITRARIIRTAGHKERHGLVRAVKSMSTLFVPLVLRTLARAERLAEAITARYYGAAPHTRYYSREGGWKQRLTVLVTLSLFAAIICVSLIHERSRI